MKKIVNAIQELLKPHETDSELRRTAVSQTVPVTRLVLQAKKIVDHELMPAEVEGVLTKIAESICRIPADLVLEIMAALLADGLQDEAYVILQALLASNVSESISRGEVKRFESVCFRSGSFRFVSLLASFQYVQFGISSLKDLGYAAAVRNAALDGETEAVRDFVRVIMTWPEEDVFRLMVRWNVTLPALMTGYGIKEGDKLIKVIERRCDLAAESIYDGRLIALFSFGFAYQYAMSRFDCAIRWAERFKEWVSPAVIGRIMLWHDMLHGSNCVSKDVKRQILESNAPGDRYLQWHWFANKGDDESVAERCRVLLMSDHDHDGTGWYLYVDSAVYSWSVGDLEYAEKICREGVSKYSERDVFCQELIHMLEIESLDSSSMSDLASQMEEIAQCQFSSWMPYGAWLVLCASAIWYSLGQRRRASAALCAYIDQHMDRNETEFRSLLAASNNCEDLPTSEHCADYLAAFTGYAPRTSFMNRTYTRCYDLLVESLKNKDPREGVN